MKKYGLLLSGGVDRRNNYIRYKNDLEFVYHVLVEDCEYAREDIRIFFADGKSLQDKGQVVHTKEAVRASLIEYLDDLIYNLTPEDWFTMVVSNHGGNAGAGYINLWGEDVLELDLLADKMNCVKAKKLIILGQCYGGNFLDFDIADACILTANERGVMSYTNPYNCEYDEFLFHFFSYIHGCYPNHGAAISGSKNNIRDAYEYALNNDVFHPNHPTGKKIRTIYGENYIEIPQMKSNLEGILQI